MLRRSDRMTAVKPAVQQGRLASSGIKME